MTLIQTATLQPNQLSGLDNLQTYCGLDCCVTLECFEEITKVHEAPAIYSFERALQAPYLDIMQRGFAVDELSRRQAALALTERIDRLESFLNEMALAMWGKSLNARSHTQLKDFFYSFMKIPEIHSYKKGQKKISMDREALEKLDDYLYARPFVQHILRIRDLGKQREFLEKPLDPDGRFRPGYNITGTETGRSSSSENAFGTGDNAQNIPETLRYPLIADPGYRMYVFDLEQSEARDVGFLCGCLFDKWKFLDNCESGDLHTSNAKLIWPELGWKNHPAQDRLIAEQIYYRDYSYRYMAKRLGHMTDYVATPYTMARILKIPLKLAEDFRFRYVTGPNAAYPEIAELWQWCKQQLQTTYSLTTPFGRQRHFFGRSNDDATLREAVAFIPQSMTADRMSLGMWRVWQNLKYCQLLGNGYDSIILQAKESIPPAKVVEDVKQLCEIPLFAPNGRKFIVPVEAKFGWNWGNEVTHQDVAKAIKDGKKPPRLNLDGLRKFSKTVPDTRVRSGNGLKRVMA